MTERGETIKADRRRRNSDALAGQGRRLFVDPAFLDLAKYRYRFANDRGTRVHDLTVNDNWDVVSDTRMRSDDLGSGVALLAGTQNNGAAMNAVLLRKTREYAEDDDRAKARHIDAKEASIKSNPDPEGGNASGLYVPGGKSAEATTISAASK